jgi:hypothetical protein
MSKRLTEIAIRFKQAPYAAAGNNRRDFSLRQAPQFGDAESALRLAIPNCRCCNGLQMAADERAPIGGR